MLTEALAVSAERCGWERVGRRRGGEVLVTDRVVVRHLRTPAEHRVVLVCEATPFGARAALDAVSELVAVAVVCCDEPADLVSALEGLLVGRVSVPLRVMDLAGEMPDLTERQLEVLAAVAAGQSNAAIGRGLYLSAASVKRELAALYAALGMSNRLELAASAQRLGVPVRCALP